jgi:hypothetical protein
VSPRDFGTGGWQSICQGKGVSMNCERRSFFGAVVLALGAVLLGPAQSLTAGQGRGQRKAPPDLAPEPPAKQQQIPILKANQKDIKRDVQRLFELAEELKKEVEKTDSSEVLSLTLVHKAEEIEKLAKRIKGLARAEQLSILPVPQR